MGSWVRSWNRKKKKLGKTKDIWIKYGLQLTSHIGSLILTNVPSNNMLITGEPGCRVYKNSL